MTFNVGDRVAIYGMLSSVDGGTCVYGSGVKGTVIRQDTGEGLTIDLDGKWFGYKERNTVDGIHPNQCRRLVEKKELRRIKVSETLLTGNGPLVFGDEDCSGLTEFIEVVRKK